ncbi:hypothetical protein QT970_22190 [Microcoleus sp. herbarium8]
MNRTNFVQTGGVPIKAERLQELQEAYSIFNNLGFIAGNFSILTGCVVTGTNVSDGVVVVNGEVLLFQGGTLSANVIIIENPVSKEFKDGSFKPLHFIRYATFGTGAGMLAWNDFKRIDPILTLMARLASLEKKTAVFQAGGGMVLWNKPANEIPNGWQEVINWRGRMPVGMDVSQTEFNTLGKISGNKNKTLSTSELPSHGHKMFDPAIGSNPLDQNPNSYVRAAGVNTGPDAYDYILASSGNVPTAGNTANTGGGQSFSILNPYRTVLFIEFIG